MTTATASERLRLYRQRHRIEVDKSVDPRFDVCDHCHIRVYQVLTRRWQHDPDTLMKLQRQAAEEQEAQRVAAVIAAASRPLRQYVVEEGPGYVVTADAEAV